jgi:hypothetical protein
MPAATRFTSSCQIVDPFLFTTDFMPPPNPDKLEPKGQNRKASHAKTQRTPRKSLGPDLKKTNNLAVLCELSVFARNILAVLSRI